MEEEEEEKSGTCELFFGRQRYGLVLLYVTSNARTLDNTDSQYFVALQTACSQCAGSIVLHLPLL